MLKNMLAALVFVILIFFFFGCQVPELLDVEWTVEKVEYIEGSEYIYIFFDPHLNVDECNYFENENLSSPLELHELASIDGIVFDDSIYFSNSIEIHLSTLLNSGTHESIKFRKGYFYGKSTNPHGWSDNTYRIQFNVDSMTIDYITP